MLLVLAAGRRERQRFPALPGRIAMCAAGPHEGLLFLALLSLEFPGSGEFAGGVVGALQLFVNAGQSIMDIGSLGVSTQAALISARGFGVAIQILQRLTLVGESASIPGCRWSRASRRGSANKGFSSRMYVSAR